VNLTHASFFSGVGGLDMGLERAGWTTVSFSEIDPYASAVLARHWPGVPNLGSIVGLAAGVPDDGRLAVATGGDALPGDQGGNGRPRHRERVDPDWTRADLWTGGFPCQDLSVAGKRKGLAGERSGLAFAFLDLVERHRPPAIVLENVPGLLSSHAGRDLGALVGRLGELGYWWAYRVLDARYFGVPQRRRRVFIVAFHARLDPVGDGPAEVLSVGSRCDRHPATGREAGPGVAAGTHVGTLDTSLGHHGGAWGDQAVAAGHIVSPSPDSDRVRAADGLAGRMDDRGVMAPTLRVGGRSQGAGSSYDNTPIVAATLNSGGNDGGFRTEPGEHLTTEGAPGAGDPLLPDGLDSHRYRCCGNGVVAPVSEWLGTRLRLVMEQLGAKAA
jgi:site-specific DNA-cytosine methylase